MRRPKKSFVALWWNMVSRVLPKTTHFLKSFLIEVRSSSRFVRILKGPLLPFLFFLELLIPEKANVYYAISTQHDLNFTLREKSEDLNAVGGTVSRDSLGLGGEGTPRGSRRPPRDNSKARRKLLGLVLWVSFLLYFLSSTHAINLMRIDWFTTFLPCESRVRAQISRS